MNKFNVLFISLFIVTSSAHAGTWVSTVTLESVKQTLSSAMSVVTKQTSVSANQAAEARVNTYKTLSDAMSTINMSNRLIDAVVSFDPHFGQPQSNSCQAVLQKGYNLQARQVANQSQQILIQNYVNDRYSGALEGSQRLIETHKSEYCTVGESKAGFCQLKANGMQGWDADYSGFSSAKTLAPDAELAGYAYAGMITDQTMSVATECHSESCRTAAMNQLKTASINSLIATAIVGQVTDRRLPEIKE